MLTCVYQPALPLSKNCLLKVNRDTKKVIVSKLSEEKGGRVKVEIAHASNPIHNHHQPSQPPQQQQHSIQFQNLYQESTPLPETCGLSISELEAMAARQQRQLETQDQLLAAKAQRLRFLKSGGEAERLQRLREKVATQEERLRKLRALRGKVQNNRGSNTQLSSDLESLRAVFNEKEKELSLAVAKVDDLTRQLDDLRRGNSKEPTNGQSVAAAELEKLRRELMYRTKLREAQATRVAAQRAALNQRQEESMRVDRRIAELQERLHRKRLLNHQLAVTLKHQESYDDEYVSKSPSKNDPKYQTLPYNAKFSPFASKVERDNFEKSMGNMQIIQNQQPQQQQQKPLKSNHLLNHNTNSYANNNLQLQQLVIQNQHNNAKSANTIQQQQQITVPKDQSSSGSENGTSVSNSTNNIALGSTTKPALPPKPPPRGVADRTDLPIKPKPLFIKKSQQQLQQQSSNLVPSSGSSNSSVTTVSNTGEKEQSTGNNGTTVRVSINRRIEMPPAFLFPESDLIHHPPPSDLLNLIPEVKPQSLSSTSSSASVPLSSSEQRLQQQQQQSGLDGRSLTQSEDLVDTAPIMKPHPVTLPEEYTLPDLFPHSNVNINNNLNHFKSSAYPHVDKERERNSHNHISDQNVTSLSFPVTSLNEQEKSSPSSPSISSSNNINSNSVKEYDRDMYFESNQSQQHQQQYNSSSPTIGNTTVVSSNSSTINNINLYRSANVNSNPSMLTFNSLVQEFRNAGASDQLSTNHQQQHQQQQNTNNENLNHISVMSIQVSSPENSSAGTKMDLSPIALESYDISERTHGSGIIDTQVDRDENASDSTNSGSTITTTTSSVSSSDIVPSNGNSGTTGVLRILKKGNLKSANREHAPLGRRVSFDPLALLLDASLEGELDLVIRTANEVGNASAANDEGITALHNAICAGHFEVVRFLVEFGCDVNAVDSDGWSPLHCAASCNNEDMVKFLVEHGACIFAVTCSDQETAAEKCEEDEDGYGPCSEYLYSVQEKLGISNGGAVYAVYDYDAQNSDELSFRNGDRLIILRKGDEFEMNWWWASTGETQGYVPKNLLGLYPRVGVPQGDNES